MALVALWRSACQSAFKIARRITLGQNGMDPVPELPIDDRLMLTGIRFPLVDGFTDVDAVADQP